MKLLESDSFWRAARRVRSTFSARVAVLMYHRIADEALDPYELCVTPKHFQEHMEVISADRRAMALVDVAAALSDGHLPYRGIAVTFDDGYADNLTAGIPVLTRLSIPATIFVTTGPGGREREFWWDQLERVMLHPGRLPKSLSLRIDGKAYQWELDEAAVYREADYQRNRSWRFGDEPDPGPRHRLFRLLFSALRPAADVQRQRAMDELSIWAGVATSARPSRRAITADEVVAISQGGLIEIGAHTRTHPPMPALPPDHQRDEAAQSKADLEQILGRRVESFAYPYGLHDERTVAAVRDAGFKRACACMERCVRPRSEIFRIPRIEVRDCDGDTFARRLRTAFGW